MIYFATIKLAEQIHAGCLGFTTMIFAFVEAASETDIPQIIETWCHNKNLKFSRVISVSVSHPQDPGKYVFPEQIIQRDGTSSHRTI